MHESHGWLIPRGDEKFVSKPAFCVGAIIFPVSKTRQIRKFWRIFFATHLTDHNPSPSLNPFRSGV
jgi:hypothetical protein